MSTTYTAVLADRKLHGSLAIASEQRQVVVDMICTWYLGHVINYDAKNLLIADYANHLKTWIEVVEELRKDLQDKNTMCCDLYEPFDAALEITIEGVEV